MPYSFVTDASGKQTGVLLDMEAWNYLTQLHSEILYGLAGNTFKTSEKFPPVNIFTDEPINLLGTESFPTEGMEN